MNLRIVVLPGDGIGPEVTTQAVAVLQTVSDVCGYEFRFESHHIGGIAIEKEGMPLPERSATIGRAYELAEGPSSRDRIALASGLTVPEAHAAGMLPYEIIPAVRKGDPLTEGEARQALMEEGGTQLGHWRKVQLRLATQEEAEAARQRFIARFPGSEEAWVIHRDITAPDFAQAFDLADDGED